MTKPKKTDPLTVREVSAASDGFFELLDEVLMRCRQRGIPVEDAIKLSESIFAYAHKLRAIDAEADSSAPFGFNKDPYTAAYKSVYATHD